VVIVFYGSLIYGVLPRDASVSFESHLGGVLAGIVCAWWNARYNIK
jgi:membrane associated rhomboid family serine protease